MPGTIVVRGERLALHRTPAPTPGGDETALFSIDELDEDAASPRSPGSTTTTCSRRRRSSTVAISAGEGAGHAEVIRLRVGRGSLASRRRLGRAPCGGLDGVPASSITDGWASSPVISTEYRVAIALGNDLPDVRFIHRKVFVFGQPVLSLSEASDTGWNGELLQWIVAAVAHFDEHGLLDAGPEWFDEDDFDSALVRLDELGAATPTDPRVPHLRERRVPVHGVAASPCSTPRTVSPLGRADRTRLRPRGSAFHRGIGRPRPP